MLKSFLHRLTICVALLLAALGAARAEDDPPGRVGRLNDVSGSVWLYDRDGAEWEAATNNWPITQGDRVATEAGARAEVRIGSTTLRLAESTEVQFERLDDVAIRVQVERGSLAARLRSAASASEFEIATREVRVQALRNGHYRVDRDGATSSVTAWDGLAEIASGASRYQLEPGRRAEFWVEAGQTQARWSDVVYDNFAGWARSDAWIDENSPSARYVSPEMTGIEDLDRHGSWVTDQDDGPLWVPHRVAPGWAPYRDGHWAWVRPWGWTWVDAAPWGFAPFHYGRWVMRRGGWCWAPGRYVQRPVFAPALVAWVGGNPSVVVGVGGARPRPPRVGWFPLGPREHYVPGYRGSDRYVRNLNGGWVHEPSMPVRRPDRYANRDVPGAVTVVEREVIARREPVFRHARRDADPDWVRQSAGGASLTPPMIAPSLGAVPGARRPGEAWLRDRRGDDTARRGSRSDRDDDGPRSPLVTRRDDDGRRPSVTRRDDDETRRPPVTRRDDDETRRPPVTRRDDDETRRPPVTRRDDAETRRPPVTRRDDDETRRPLVTRRDDDEARRPPGTTRDRETPPRRPVITGGDDEKPRRAPDASREDDRSRRLADAVRDADPPRRASGAARDDDDARRALQRRGGDERPPRAAVEPRRVEPPPVVRQADPARSAQRAESSGAREARRGAEREELRVRRAGRENDR